MKSAFATNMVAARKNLGLTQQAAADLLKMNRSTLASYEESRAEPGFENLKKIVKYYQIYDVLSFIWSEDYKMFVTPSALHKGYLKANRKIKNAVDILLQIGDCQ